jgi:hypothetical protein
VSDDGDDDGMPKSLLKRRPRARAFTPAEVAERAAAATKLQAAYRSRRARGYVRALVEAVYRKYFDEASGYFYYYNTATGQSSWTKPKALRRGA